MPFITTGTRCLLSIKAYLIKAGTGWRALVAQRPEEV